MNFKDYYQLLELPPSASPAEIKKAYRALAMRYHPDKTNSDPYQNLRFSEIKEAYETLSNPSKKELYIQQRWYYQHSKASKSPGTLNPVSLLRQFIELEKYVSTIDIHRMNKGGLYQFILAGLGDDAIEQLNALGDLSINDEISNRVISSSRELPLKLTLPLYDQLRKIKISHEMEDQLHQSLLQHYRSYRWAKYKVWVILFILLILCLIIVFFSK